MAYTFAEAGTPGIVTFIIAILGTGALSVGLFMLARNLRKEALTRAYPARNATVWRRILAVVVLLVSVFGAVTGAPYIFATFIVSTSGASGDGGLTALINYTLFSLVAVAALSLGAMLWRAGGAYPGHDAQKASQSMP